MWAVFVWYLSVIQISLYQSALEARLYIADIVTVLKDKIYTVNTYNNDLVVVECQVHNILVKCKQALIVVLNSSPNLLKDFKDVVRRDVNFTMFDVLHGHLKKRLCSSFKVCVKTA